MDTAWVTHATCGTISLHFVISIPPRRDYDRRMLLVIDNYDSFTYNLVQYLGEMGVEMQVQRNDQISLEQIRALKPDRILISPGPCSPRESGLSNEIIRTFSSQI